MTYAESRDSRQLIASNPCAYIGIDVRGHLSHLPPAQATPCGERLGLRGLRALVATYEIHGTLYAEFCLPSISCEERVGLDEKLCQQVALGNAGPIFRIFVVSDRVNSGALLLIIRPLFLRVIVASTAAEAYTRKDNFNTIA